MSKSKIVAALLGGFLTCTLLPSARASHCDITPSPCDGSQGLIDCRNPFKCAIVHGFVDDTQAYPQGTTIRVEMFYFPGACGTATGRADFYRDADVAPYATVDIDNANTAGGLPWPMLNAGFVLAQADLILLGFDIAIDTSMVDACSGTMQINDDAPLPPETWINPPTPADPTTLRNETFNFDSSATSVEFEVEINGGGFPMVGASTSQAYGPTQLLVGTNTFKVRSKDLGTGLTDPTPATFTWTILPAPTTTELVAAPSTSDCGASVNLSAAVFSDVGVPQGTVTFKDGVMILGNAGLNLSGQAAISHAFTSAGTHLLTAEYTPSLPAEHVASSTPSPLEHIVDPLPPAVITFEAFPDGPCGADGTALTGTLPTPASTQFLPRNLLIEAVGVAAPQIRHEPAAPAVDDPLDDWSLTAGISPETGSLKLTFTDPPASVTFRLRGSANCPFPIDARDPDGNPVGVSSTSSMYTNSLGFAFISMNVTVTGPVKTLEFALQADCGDGVVTRLVAIDNIAQSF